ncbi:MAG TPA: VOC family protein [Acidimicrobiales bacterium]|nr:VOC family protein [Acidimicrobiales bacterium]
MTTYPHGMPSWVDYTASDVSAALGFYSSLLGWDSQDLGEESGHYTMVSKGGKLIAAVSPSAPGDPSPPHWTTYVNVDDIGAVTAKVADAGGATLFGPMDVMTAGKMAVYTDTTGAVIAAWQPGDHPGAQLVNEPGALVWNELNTRDLGKSRSFYSDVFGWSWGGTDEYAEAQINGRTIGAAMPRPTQMPAEVPDHWLVYFGTADVDADSERATTAGATLVVGPQDVPDTGRFAVLVDPLGSVFGLFQG